MFIQSDIRKRVFGHHAKTDEGEAFGRRLSSKGVHGIDHRREASSVLARLVAMV